MRRADGLHVDDTQKGAGRGAYLCRTRACWDSRDRDKRIGAALKLRLNPADTDYLNSWARAHVDELT
jgi:predicted RNA-binding protein YlxR (DUF448 family)